MISLSHGLPAKLSQRPKRATEVAGRPPANGFWHDGKLNMGPAICLAVTLSLLGWAGIIIGVGYVIRHVI
jgi:hypothetical protein